TTTLRGQTDTITATYDPFGRQTSLDDPDKGLWTYINSALGQVLEQTDARGNVTTSTYDRLGRPLTRTTAEAGGASEQASWFYYDASASAANHWVEVGDNGWIGALAREESLTIGAAGLPDPGTVRTHYYDDFGRPWMDMRGVAGTWFYSVMEYDPVQKHLVKSVEHYWRPIGAETASQSPYVWRHFGYRYTYDDKSYVRQIDDTSSAARTWWKA